MQKAIFVFVNLNEKANSGYQAGGYCHECCLPAQSGKRYAVAVADAAFMESPLLVVSSAIIFRISG
jgi:hypothetical protein